MDNKRKSGDPLGSLFAEVDALRAESRKAEKILRDMNDLLAEYDRTTPRRMKRKTKTVYARKAGK
jgi:hypothetical protein